MNESPEQYNGKYVTVYMVYATSKDRQEGRSSSHSTESDAKYVAALAKENGWDAVWCKQTYEVED